MSNATTLKAEVRSKLGTSGSAQVRKEQKLPAVVYGPELKENIFVTIDYREFEKVFKSCGKHTIIDLQVGGKSYQTLVKDLKIHSITRNFLHVDFQAISPTKRFTTEVPVNYTGNPVGVKEGGGLYVFQRKMKIYTDLASMPKSIDVDITNLKINQYLIIRDIPKTGNYKILTHEGTTLVEIK